MASPEEIWCLKLAQEMGHEYIYIYTYIGDLWRALVTALQNLWFYSEMYLLIKVKNADPKQKPWS